MTNQTPEEKLTHLSIKELWKLMRNPKTSEFLKSFIKKEIINRDN